MEAANTPFPFDVMALAGCDLAGVEDKTVTVCRAVVHRYGRGASLAGRHNHVPNGAATTMAT